MPLSPAPRATRQQRAAPSPTEVDTILSEQASPMTASSLRANHVIRLIRKRVGMAGSSRRIPIHADGKVTVRVAIRRSTSVGMARGPGPIITVSANRLGRPNDGINTSIYSLLLFILYHFFFCSAYFRPMGQAVPSLR